VTPSIDIVVDTAHKDSILAFCHVCVRLSLLDLLVSSSRCRFSPEPAGSNRIRGQCPLSLSPVVMWQRCGVAAAAAPVVVGHCHCHRHPSCHCRCHCCPGCGRPSPCYCHLSSLVAVSAVMWVFCCVVVVVSIVMWQCCCIVDGGGGGRW
jgi:hypothetical protein